MILTEVEDWPLLEDDDAALTKPAGGDEVTGSETAVLNRAVAEGDCVVDEMMESVTEVVDDGETTSLPPSLLLPFLLGAIYINEML